MFLVNGKVHVVKVGDVGGVGGTEELLVLRLHLLDLSLHRRVCRPRTLILPFLWSKKPIGYIFFLVK